MKYTTASLIIVKHNHNKIQKQAYSLTDIIRNDGIFIIFKTEK